MQLKSKGINSILKISIIVFLIIMLLFISACGNKSNKPEYKDLKINEIKASLYNGEGYEPKKIKNAFEQKLYDDQNQKVNINNYNYFVMFQSYGKATITVTVANPESVDITMLKIASTDENATIRTLDNDSDVWQKISDYPYVKWNGSNAYKTTFDVETTKAVEEVEFSVVDLKVNDNWIKSTNLGNNKLHIYKMTDNAIEIEEISKDIQKYVFDVKVNDTNITVTNVNVEKGSDEHYTTTASGEIIITYTYKLGTTGLISNAMTYTKEISLVKITASVAQDEEGNCLVDKTTGEFKLQIQADGTSTYTIYSKNGTAENNMFIYTVSSWDGIDDLYAKVKDIILADEFEYNGIDFTLELSEGNAISNWIFTNK